MLSERDLPISLHKELQTPTLVEAEHPMLLQPDALVHGSEIPLFVVCAIISGLFYFVLFLSLLPFSLLVLLFLPLGFLGQGLLLGHLRGNAIRVSQHQFPEIYEAAGKISAQLGMMPPPIYVMESGGMINAFAARFLMRDYVILFSDVVELAYARGEDALNFVVAHELAHIRRGHLKWRWLLGPASMFPTLVRAYYRACEYTCDKMAALCVPSGAIEGILVLSAGKQLYRHVNVQAFAAQIHQEGGFWTWAAELFSTHPHLSKRLNALMLLPFVKVAQAS